MSWETELEELRRREALAKKKGGVRSGVWRSGSGARAHVGEAEQADGRGKHQRPSSGFSAGDGKTADGDQRNDCGEISKAKHGGGPSLNVR